MCTNMQGLQSDAWEAWQDDDEIRRCFSHGERPSDELRHLAEEKRVILNEIERLLEVERVRLQEMRKQLIEAMDLSTVEMNIKRILLLNVKIIPRYSPSKKYGYQLMPSEEYTDDAVEQLLSDAGEPEPVFRSGGPKRSRLSQFHVIKTRDDTHLLIRHMTRDQNEIWSGINEDREILTFDNPERGNVSALHFAELWSLD